MNALLALALALASVPAPPLASLLGAYSQTVLNTLPACQVVSGDPPRLRCRTQIGPSGQPADALFLLDDAVVVTRIVVSIHPQPSQKLAEKALRPLLADLTARHGQPRESRTEGTFRWCLWRPRFSGQAELHREAGGWTARLELADPSYRPVTVFRGGAEPGPPPARAPATHGRPSGG